MRRSVRLSLPTATTALVLTLAAPVHAMSVAGAPSILRKSPAAGIDAGKAGARGAASASPSAAGKRGAAAAAGALAGAAASSAAKSGSTGSTGTTSTPPAGKAGSATAPAATTPTTTFVPSGGTPPAATTPATGVPGTRTATTPSTTPSQALVNKGKATTKPGHHDGLSALAIIIAVLAALVVLACAAWAVARHRAYEPHWWLSLRHAMAETGFRISATWAEFTDWARLGR